MPKIQWNEANTFSKKIIPYLVSELGYPTRDSKFLDEQTYVRKRGGNQGPYDAVYKDNRGPLLLIEAKKLKKELGLQEINQAIDYALGKTFDLFPPPYILVSSGTKNIWLRRTKRSEKYEYKRCNQIKWKDLIREREVGKLKEELTLRQLIKLLQKTRSLIFNNLSHNFFPNEFNFSSCKLGDLKTSFDKILFTRKTFIDPNLETENENEQIKAVVSSISLSLTFKILFIKILTDLNPADFPEKIEQFIIGNKRKFPGILGAEPYGLLFFDKNCEKILYELFSDIGVSNALFFGDEVINPIGEIWDQLIHTEEQDIQVKSLGNVYTPSNIVNAMVNSVGKNVGDWRKIKILEPSCGSGHFLRVVYQKVFKSFFEKSRDITEQKAIDAHISAIKSIRALDIDPFAVQTSQLGMFIELYKNPSVWKAIAPENSFNFNNFIDIGDYLEDGILDVLRGFIPDLIIGNPPYGVSVSDEVRSRFKLGSNDSYGCFIGKSLELVKEKGFISFIVSNTFFTTRTHIPLRNQIFEKSYPVSFLNLHRNAFPGRDVFCCIMNLQKKGKGLENSSYYFFDAWPIHPTDPDYVKVFKFLEDSYDSDPEIDDSKFGIYQIPFDLGEHRVFPPGNQDIDKALNYYKKENIKPPKFFDIKLLKKSGQFPAKDFKDKFETIVYPILTGSPSLFAFCLDSEMEGFAKLKEINFPIIGKVNSLIISKEKTEIPVVKLWQIAEVRQGLATADDPYFIRKSPWVIPNARRKDTKDADPKNCIYPEELYKLTENEKKNGIKVLDKKTSKYFIPFDKGGEQDTKSGELIAIAKDVDYWIDWSEQSVKLLKSRSKLPSGTPKKAFIRNPENYFSKGIACSVTGLYAPTFWLSFGGIFSHKANLILPFEERLVKYLVIYLNSTFIRYVAKNFIGNTVDFSTDYFRHLPIIVPTEKQFKKTEKLFDELHPLVCKRKIQYAEIKLKVDNIVNDELLKLNSMEKAEIATWFKRRYHLFGRSSS